MRKIKTILLTLYIPIMVSAQTALSDAIDDARFSVEVGTTINNGATPLWLAANKNGTVGIQNNNAWIRTAVFRPAEADSSYNWRIGYGLDLIGGPQLTRKWSGWIQQAFIDIELKKVRLSIGTRERPMELKDQELSSGSQTFGINARPIPQVRVELPDYILFSRTLPWLSIKGHFGYGMMMDGPWQKYYLKKDRHYALEALLHSKALYLKIGNEQHFPLSFETGIEMATIFGGKVKNAMNIKGYNFTMSHNLKSFLKAIYSGGSDPTDDQYANAEGNTLGSLLFSLRYQAPSWYIRGYMDHFFEDHSQLFFQYGWKDYLVGIEAGLPKNRIISKIVYEYIKTDYQSGPIYHDHTTSIPDQISGMDNYYNHVIYQGWQYFGQAIGNPLFTSPLYNNNKELYFSGNRFRAHHLGITSNPINKLHLRFLYTHEKNWGTYNLPYLHGSKNLNSFLFEGSYKFGKDSLKEFYLTAAIGLDNGTQIGKNKGFQLKLSKIF